MNYNFSHTNSLRVRYAETDQMGYCYYGNYASYFEVGRVEALRSLGCSYKQLEDDGIMLPVSSYHVDYKKPALYDDLLEIKTKISSINGARIVFDYEITKEDGKTIIAIAQTTLVFVKKENMRPCPPPSSFIQLISTYQHD